MHIFREERQVYATMRACSEALQKARSLRDAIKGTALFPVGDSLRHKEEVLVEQERSADAEMAVCYQKMLCFLGEEANHADITERKMLQDYILRQFAQERVEDQALAIKVAAARVDVPRAGLHSAMLEAPPRGQRAALPGALHHGPRRARLR